MHLAANEDCEAELERYVLRKVEAGKLPTALQCSKRFGDAAKTIPLVTTSQHPLSDYDQLLTEREVLHG